MSFLGLCAGSDAAVAQANAREEYQNVGTVVKGKGLPEDDQLMIDFAVVAADMSAFETFISKVDATGMYEGQVPAACGIIEMSDGILAKLATLGNAYAVRFSTASPAAGLKNKGAGALSDLLTIALVIGGAYLGYKLLFGDRSIMDVFGHGSDDYPKAKLPRYAGGRRRLA
jgi:hypothetical protein